MNLFRVFRLSPGGDMRSYLLFSLAFLLAACSSEKPTMSKFPPQENNRGTELVDEENLAQNFDPNWYVGSPEVDGVEGTNADRAISEFALTHKNEVIVAVLDSGVDINHEDLQGKIWTNPGESGLDEKGVDKASNGIDDDGNGYIDDVHGWNYLGNADGVNIDADSLEVTRELVRYEARISRGEVLDDWEVAYLEKVKAEYEEGYGSAKEALDKYAPIKEEKDQAKQLLVDRLGQEDFSLQALQAIQSDDEDVAEAVESLVGVLQSFGSLARIDRIFDYYNSSVQYYFNKDFNPRADIIGDDESDFTQVGYGNNDVTGPDSSHGTHVAGIIAANRNNGIGVRGIAENVKIMALRMVPNGDEHDKDVALAVRYAADMGAKVINMSFGKGYSPFKSEVDKAFQYAAEKGVLIVHAAGNDSKNNDQSPSYPNRSLREIANVPLAQLNISNWVDVGASAATKGLDLVASFSNYGKTVDIFSPGYQIISTTPGNSYDVYNGTSMASPAFAGVAALLLSNFKGMTGEQVKAILLDQARLYEGLKVRQPGASTYDLPVPFASLSNTGGVVDAYKAVSLAYELLD